MTNRKLENPYVILMKKSVADCIKSRDLHHLGDVCISDEELVYFAVESLPILPDDYVEKNRLHARMHYIKDPFLRTINSLTAPDYNKGIREEFEAEQVPIEDLKDWKFIPDMFKHKLESMIKMPAKNVSKVSILAESRNEQDLSAVVA